MRFLPFLVIFTILLQLGVLLWVKHSTLLGEQIGRLSLLIWGAIVMTILISAFYVVALLHLPRFSPGLLLFVVSLLGAGFQLAAVATRTYSARQIRLGAWLVMVCLVLFYVLNTFSP